MQWMCPRCGLTLLAKPVDFPIYLGIGFFDDAVGPGVTENATPYVFPCGFRGEPIGTVDCELCGGRRQVADVYACKLFQRCTMSRPVGPDPPKSCLTCEDAT